MENPDKRRGAPTLIKQLGAALSFLLGQRKLHSVRPPLDWLRRYSISTAAYSKGSSRLENIVFYSTHVAYICDTEKIVDISKLRLLSRGFFPCFRDCRKLISAVTGYEGSPRGLDHPYGLPSRKRTSNSVLSRSKKLKLLLSRSGKVRHKVSPPDLDSALDEHHYPDFHSRKSTHGVSDFSSDYYKCPDSDDCPSSSKGTGSVGSSDSDTNNADYSDDPLGSDDYFSLHK